MKTIPKTILKIYLTFGLFNIFAIYSCKKEKNLIVEYYTKGNYVYKNKLNNNIKIEIVDILNSSTINLPIYIKSNDSIVLSYTNVPVAFPFKNGKAQNGNKFNIIFENGKCISYYRENTNFYTNGNGVFGAQNYDNYTSDLSEKKEYTLIYSISEKDLLLAKECK